MPWWFSIGRPLGIPVRVHLSLLLLISVVEVIDGIGGDFHLGRLALFVSAYACVILHELGHAIAARRFGRETKSILLLPIGGIADLDPPEAPRQELVVAIAGPAVNLAIAALALAGLLVVGVPYETSSDVDSVTVFVSWILRINVTIALFNLLPVYPMDGGRVLRALLATRGSRDRATVAAATIGRWGGFLLAAAGVPLLNPVLVPLGLLMALAATSERSAARRRLADKNRR